jgi:hypothetical protein
LVFLSFVEPSLVRPHLDCRVVAAADVVELLEFRAIPAGMPVFLDEHTMRPIEPVCSWFRHLAYEDKDAKTLREGERAKSRCPPSQRVRQARRVLAGRRGSGSRVRAGLVSSALYS